MAAERDLETVYYPVKLESALLGGLTLEERAFLLPLIKAAEVMDTLFWLESFGPPEPFLSSISDPQLRQYAQWNYGPYDRLKANEPFLPGFPPKPAGACFYPPDMNREEFENWNHPDKTNPYSVVRRDPTGQLQVIPYHIYFQEYIQRACAYLDQAIRICPYPDMQRYLQKRKEALLTDRYEESEIAWLEMQSNRIDFIIGPIESYEDQLFGYRAAHEAYIAIKDVEATKAVQTLLSLLPMLQASLPVPSAYKKEKPANPGDIGVYDAIFYAGDCNAGAKTIAVNLPNAESIQLQYGTRRLQFRNVMKAKFDHILMPIANAIIDPNLMAHVTFAAFFYNTMFHEIAHGLGIKYTVHSNPQPVSRALKANHSIIEEAKADVLGLWMLTYLIKQKRLQNVTPEEAYTTFVASIFRSIRFGASSAHGVANMITLKSLMDQGAITLDTVNLTITIHYEKMDTAITQLAEAILVLQGNGDYDLSAQWVQEARAMETRFVPFIRKIQSQRIPVDISFQFTDVEKLKKELQNG